MKAERSMLRKRIAFLEKENEALKGVLEEFIELQREEREEFRKTIHILKQLDTTQEQVHS